MPSITVNEKITLKLATLSDAPQFFNTIQENQVYLRKYIPWVDQIQKEKDAEKFILKWRENYQYGKGFNFLIFYENQLVGTIGFNYFDHLNKKTDIGYWLTKKSQGRGIIQDCCIAIMRYVFLNLRFHRIEVRCAVDNFPSQRIPERLGFTREGILRDSMLIEDEFVDSILYSILSTDDLAVPED